ncbi:thiamine pyrophosphokinase [Philodulcilactobacillus myokoensis]|uniref:Thiamine diphosphokinase n=1 Tax=Philodulcilactobacillus myokoensis TaxID=2929573 RepID=A0A9W6B1J6_9LACO|nr:thiamine diphosphokinase [Philodulcilactobacillus myokoensis]GLB46815.1 thiamine pyrophosphokinase [Philodulcilactobacillus myokoensis]
MTTVNLLVGGPTEFWPTSLKKHQFNGKWVGADRGNLRLIKMGITPSIAIGDFDSMNQDELNLVKHHVKTIISSSPIKDDTDTELGLKITMDHFNFDQINIFGATGGRIDHFLTNLFMMLEPRFRPIVPKVKIIDNQNTINFYLPGKHFIDKENDKHYLAFVPLETMHLTLNDEKYRLNHRLVKYPTSYSSNEFIGQRNHFEFDHGILCVIQSKDK